VAVGELADQESMLGRAREGGELLCREGEAGGVELVGADRQLGGALEIGVRGRSDGQRHAEGAQVLDPRADEGLLFAP
jgi:hypothetical protein